MEYDQMVKAIHELDEKIETTSRGTNNNTFYFNAQIAALIEILGLTTDQVLDMHNLTKKKYSEFLSEYSEKQKSSGS